MQGTFVGTPLYVAPEMLDVNQSGRFTDLWALGCIIYEMIEGQSPFMDENNSKVFANIMERNFQFSKKFDENSIDLINKLLQINPADRLGYKNMNELKMHPFFEGINFEKINKGEYDASDIIEIPPLIETRKQSDLDDIFEFSNSEDTHFDSFKEALALSQT